MTPGEARSLVRSMRRQFILASVSRFAVLTLVAVGFLGALLEHDATRRADALWYAAMFAALAWVLLTVFSVRQVRTANQASIYISSGRLDLAEEQLRSSMRQFSLYRTGKLLACHNLAVVVHGRKNYSVAAELCDGVISLQGGISRSVGRLCRILLADCRLSLGDPVSAFQAIEPLSVDDPALGLSERLMLLPIELRCQVSREQFQPAAASLAWKVRLAELLDAPKAALVHALLARACGREGEMAVAAFLQRRAELYYDLHELAGEYEILRDSVSDRPSADNSIDNAP